MARLEDEIKQPKFQNEHIKSHLNVLFTANWLYNKISSQLKPFNLTHEQFNVLRILKGSHPNKMSQKDVLSRMIAPKSNITLIVKKLVVKELIVVQQSAMDKREYEINITEAGLCLLDQVGEALINNSGSIGKLNESEAFHLNALLDKLRDE
jgi:DNA-binding MarR family transcriptional regulator